MAKSLREWSVPVLFIVEGLFWVAIVALGGGDLLLFAALAGVASGLMLLARPSSWVTRPLAGASALFALALTLFQLYQAATLVGSDLSTVGITSGVIFLVFAGVSVFLELETMALPTSAAADA
ncbi:MAG: hypothetical protein JRN58_05320 [Nitrososphaerota archaeon]|nr:hypothetical protein [Nitrososphaerota archaeon]MDG6978484.1 hypothetical protein [Nitrososphaerota archaeon]MDG7022268.1 hypothetical protein [Nitrososphaerota archaeon]